eukprot:gene1339-21199_t
MTNHAPGYTFCPKDPGAPAGYPWLANNVIESLFIGGGSADVNAELCKTAPGRNSAESPAGVRQYDGAFYLYSTRWANMTTLDCNYKFPIHLYDSWPLGASPSDAAGPW